jgi:transcription antitermination factor NusG
MPTKLNLNVSGLSGAMHNIVPISLSRSTDSLPAPHRETPCWFAIQTWPQYEKKVAAEFLRKSLDVFLPLVSSKRKWSDRYTVLELPLFPSYVFLRVEGSSNARIGVLRTNGVIGFVGERGRGTPIPEAQIESVRSLITSGVTYQQYAHLTIGKRVRVRGGSLDGVEGTLLEKKGDLSLLVAIELLQRSLAISVAGYRIEPV